MRLDLEGHFVARDVVPFPDPFEGRWTFHIARIGCREYQQWLRRHQQGNPLYKALAETVARVAFKRAIKRQLSEEVGRGNGSADDSSASESAAVTAEALEEATEHMSFGDVDLANLETTEGVARHLIRGVDGLHDADTQKPVAYTWEIGQQLLQSTAIVPDGRFAGMTLGAALMTWVHECAGDTERYRQRHLAESGKESSPTAAGPSTGPS